MFDRVIPTSNLQEKYEDQSKPIKISEIKVDDNNEVEKFSDVLIDTMVNSDEYSAIDLANTIMNHCSPEVMLESLKRNITKNKALIVNNTKTDTLIKAELVNEYNKAIVADAYISLKRSINPNIC